VIDSSAARGLIRGVGNAQYALDKSVTRTEFMHMLQNVLKIPGIGGGLFGLDNLTSRLGS